MNEMNELKNCPFCGRKVSLKQQERVGDYESKNVEYDIVCSTSNILQCFIGSDGVGWYLPKEKIIDMWNSRVGG